MVLLRFWRNLYCAPWYLIGDCFPMSHLFALKAIQSGTARQARRPGVIHRIPRRLNICCLRLPLFSAQGSCAVLDGDTIGLALCKTQVYQGPLVGSWVIQEIIRFHIPTYYALLSLTDYPRQISQITRTVSFGRFHHCSNEKANY